MHQICIAMLKRLLILIVITTVHTGASAQVARVLTLADSLVGGVGGIAVDRLGNVYSADFMDTVWRIKPDGRVTKFATGLYAPSGNFFDNQGNLLQSNFSGHYISKIDRNGEHEIWVEEGLNGPVGITVTTTNEVYVTECRANEISRVEENQVAETFADGDLFNCPNGITQGPDGALYVVNFSDTNVIRIDESGKAEVFAVIPGGGNGHIAFARGNFYVTAFQTNQIYRVTPTGDVFHVAGTGAFGEADGAPEEAVFTFPNGIAVDPAKGDRLFVNDYINRTPPTVDVPPIPLANIRMLKLESISDVLTREIRKGGPEAMLAGYRAFKSDPATASLFTEREVNAYGYALLNQGLLDAAVAIWEVNAESYPAAFNAWDSLAEGYMNQGKDDLAIEHYEKSLSLNAANQNAIEMIAKIKSK